jgi:dienelactone hydrolase
VEGLARRDYGGGLLQVDSVLASGPLFTRSVITYPSDGLRVFGFMNVPVGEGPFPVALVLHGYVPPENYAIMTYTARYADALAQAGYIAIHPNYRNFPPSDQTEAFIRGGRENDYRVGYAVDVLNLMAIVREQAGRPGPLLQADGADIHLLGHSMGGGITLRVITVDQNVSAAVLYGAMSGDERRNYEKILEWSNGAVGADVLATPPEDLARISPIYHLARITAPVSIHHGALDDTVPPQWSDELCQLLGALQKTVECFNYADQPHTFYGAGDMLFQERVLDFFSRY